MKTKVQALSDQSPPALANGIEYQAFPLSKGKILVRLENLQDKFDSTAAPSTVNLVTFAKQFWSQANGGSQSPIPKISETLHDGVVDKFKTEWFAQKNQQKSFENVKMLPMGIRSFVIDYNWYNI